MLFSANFDLRGLSKLLPSWPPVRVDGACRAAVRGRDRLDPVDPLDCAERLVFAWLMLGRTGVAVWFRGGMGGI